MKHRNALLWTAKACVFTKGNFNAFSLYTVVFLSIDTIYAPAFTTAVFFPADFADFRAAFLQEHESILRNMIVYRDITIYRKNVKTLRFLENLHSESVKCFAP